MFSFTLILLFFDVFQQIQTSNYLPKEDFQSKIGLDFPQTLFDLTCLASTFPSRYAKEQSKENHCFTHVFYRYEEIREIPSMFYDQIDQCFISNVYPVLGIKGLHLKVIERKVNSLAKCISLCLKFFNV